MKTKVLICIKQNLPKEWILPVDPRGIWQIAEEVIRPILINRRKYTVPQINEWVNTFLVEASNGRVWSGPNE